MHSIQPLSSPTHSGATLDSQQDVLEKLLDSYEAIRSINNLTSKIGAFVCRARLEASARTLDQRRAERPHQPNKKRKIRRTDVFPDHPTEDLISQEEAQAEAQAEVEDSEESSGETNEWSSADIDDQSSIQRMVFLYRNLERTQALFETEIERFIDATENSCRIAEEQNQRIESSE